MQKLRGPTHPWHLRDDICLHKWTTYLPKLRRALCHSECVCSTVKKYAAELYLWHFWGFVMSRNACCTLEHWVRCNDMSWKWKRLEEEEIKIKTKCIHYSLTLNFWIKLSWRWTSVDFVLKVLLKSCSRIISSILCRIYWKKMAYLSVL